MSDRDIQSYRASAEKTKHQLHNYPSLGMSHSFGASFKNTFQEEKQISSQRGHDTENYLSISEVGNASDISGPLKGFRNVEFGSVSLTTGSRNCSNSKPSSQGYPISYLSQPSGRGFISNYDKETSDLQVSKSQLDRNFVNSTSALSISRGDFSSLHPAIPMCAETSHSTASQIQPWRFHLGELIGEGGRSSVPFVIGRQESADHFQSMQAFRKNLRDIDPRILKRGYGDYQSDSTLLLSQEKKDMCSTFGKSVIQMSRKDDGSFLMVNDVSPKHNHSQAFFQEQHQVIQNLTENGLFPSWRSSSKLEMLYQQRCLQTRFSSAHDVKTMRTFTPANFVRRTDEGPHMMSETARSLLNWERVNDSFCKDNRIFEKSEVLDLNKNSRQLSGHSQQGVKLQLLDSSLNSGGIESVKHPSDFLCVSKNELSVETGALDTDIKENHVSGAKSFPISKDARTYLKLSSTDASVSCKEVRPKPIIPVIPDLNIALPEFPGADNLMGHLDPSTHRSKNSGRGSLNAVETTIKTRTKKRKVSDILNLGDSPRQEIVNKSSSQIRKGRRTKPELTFAGKEVIVLDSDDDADDVPALVMFGGSSSKELKVVKKKTSSDKDGKTPSAGVWETKEITPHSWLRNWSLKSPTVQQTAQENPKKTLVYKPQSSYVSFEPIRKKEVTSAAAMDVIANVFIKPININDKGKGPYQGPEESSLKLFNK